MEQKNTQSKIKAKCQSSAIEEKVTLPNNLFLDESGPQVKVILVDKNKNKKINIDPNELLMEFHCEV